MRRAVRAFCWALVVGLVWLDVLSGPITRQLDRAGRWWERKGGSGDA